MLSLIWLDADQDDNEFVVNEDEGEEKMTEAEGEID